MKNNKEIIICYYITFLLHVAVYNGHLQDRWLAKERGLADYVTDVQVLS